MGDKDIRQVIQVIQVNSWGVLILGVMLLGAHFMDPKAGFWLPLSLVSTTISGAAVHIGRVLVNQQRHLEQLEEKLARLTTAMSPPQPQQP